MFLRGLVSASQSKKDYIVYLLFLAVPASAAEAKRTTSAPQVPFSREIAPIIHRNCPPCHKPGESTPFSLLTYEDVKHHAHQIADVTKRRYMPPWPPETGYADFVEERRLTAAQIRLIQEWVQQGAEAGSATGSPHEAAIEPE